MGKRILYDRGQKLGHCFYLEDAESPDIRRWGRFLCQCGAEFTNNLYDVKICHTTSCGCGIISGKNVKSINPQLFKAEYKIYTGIKTRCYNKNSKSYSRYGGRGIVMCDRWAKSFDSFLEDMGPRPSPKHSVERIENEGIYEPNNCKWATAMEQAKNKRNNHYITHNGESLHIQEWSRRLGLSHACISKRLQKGMPIDRILTRERYFKGTLLPHKISLVINWA
jgi:hypothetical protein